jgi:hypothetical protein
MRHRGGRIMSMLSRGDDGEVTGGVVRGAAAFAWICCALTVIGVAQSSMWGHFAEMGGFSAAAVAFGTAASQLTFNARRRVSPTQWASLFTASLAATISLATDPASHWAWAVLPVELSLLGIFLVESAG